MRTRRERDGVVRSRHRRWQSDEEVGVTLCRTLVHHLGGLGTNLLFGSTVSDVRVLYCQVDDVSAIVRAGLHDLARIDRSQHRRVGQRNPFALTGCDKRLQDRQKPIPGVEHITGTDRCGRTQLVHNRIENEKLAVGQQHGARAAVERDRP